jgi:hypothetical protein
MIKSRKMRWARHAARMVAIKNTENFPVKKIGFEEKDIGAPGIK